MSSYLYFIVALILAVAIIGFVAPIAISDDSDLAVIVGVLIVLTLPAIIILIYRRWLKTNDGKNFAKRLLPLLLIVSTLAACSDVPAGHVGVIVNLYGGSKGVSEREVGVGRYWLSWNEKLHLFPTFTQNDVWRYTKDKDESITFQTGKDGMVISADFGITFKVDPSKITVLFQTYRRGIDEISDIYLRNLVRDAVNEKAADYSADEAYGKRKNELLDAIEATVKTYVSDRGIVVEKVYLIGEMRLPQAVRQSIDDKNRAFQATLQREQEIIKARAEAEIKIAEAHGRAESTLLEAKAQAEANRLVAASITPELVHYRALDKWNGELPRLTGAGPLPFIDITSETRNAK